MRLSEFDTLRDGERRVVWEAMVKRCDEADALRKRSEEAVGDATVALLPCPFCGSRHVDMHLAHDVPAPDNGMRFVRCSNCGASTANRQKSEAIASWNDRRLLASRLHTVDSSGKRRWLVNETQRLCDRVVWCQASRASGDIDADLDALEEQRCVVEHIMQGTQGGEHE